MLSEDRAGFRAWFGRRVEGLRRRGSEEGGFGEEWAWEWESEAAGGGRRREEGGVKEEKVWVFLSMH